MSADFWLKCPICKLDEDTVRIDGVYEIDVNADGTIDTSSVRGRCINCNTRFEERSK